MCSSKAFSADKDFIYSVVDKLIWVTAYTLLKVVIGERREHVKRLEENIAQTSDKA